MQASLWGAPVGLVVHKTTRHICCATPARQASCCLRAQHQRRNHLQNPTAHWPCRVSKQQSFYHPAKRRQASWSCRILTFIQTLWRRQEQWSRAAFGNKHTPVTVQVQPCQAGLVSSLQSAHPLTWVAVLLLAFVVKKTLDTPSRTYDPDNPNVGHEYDVWTE